MNTYKNKIVSLSNQERSPLGLPQKYLLRREGNEIHAPNLSHAWNTRKQVKELRSANLSMTMSEIANRVSISRQRVFQILREDGLPTKHYVSVKKYQYQCLVCGTISSHKFCSDECKKKWQQVPIVCTRYGKLFYRNITQFLHNYCRHSLALFCSKDCVGKWVGELYGFKSCVNRIVSSDCTSKYK